ncbi:unnamed protein product [Moneuplotes crassus]|uniref:Cyclin N-terminal domain-containing protein n=1 Tax=Euplotes crassus TaxID=5936 RepID=A0AAD1UAK7_EUPCR|nr:unnamed protein product [Moneuplotes crassus]
MKNWDETNNQIAHHKKLRAAKPMISSNVRHTKNHKSAKTTVNRKTPLCTQKYFSPENLSKAPVNFPTGKQELRGKNLFPINHEVQGGGYIEDKELGIEGTNSFMNSTGNPSSSSTNASSFPLSGSTNKVQTLPIFKLLQVFKLQQYAKTFADLGHGFEVYKIALLLPKQRHELLRKLNLMPGHRARFLSLFEIVDQIYPKEEKFRMLQNSKKVTKSRPDTVINPAKYYSNPDVSKRPIKKKRTLMKQYNMLDKKAKQDINDKFIKRIKENRISSAQVSQGISIQNVLEKHVSKAKTRKAMKKIFPPSLYEKYHTDGSSNSRSRSKKRMSSAKNRRKVHNAVKRNKLPPLPEALPKSQKYVGTNIKSNAFEIQRNSSGVTTKSSVAGRRSHHSQQRRKEDFDVRPMSATKYSIHSTNQTRQVKSGSKARNHSEDRRVKTRKPHSLTREKSKGRKQRTAANRNRSKYSKNSKSKSGSRKYRKIGSREAVLSTSSASNAGRLISSASNSDKRSSYKTSISQVNAQVQKLERIEEKPRKNYPNKDLQNLINQRKDPRLPQQKEQNLRSERRVTSKECKGNISNTYTTIKGESADKDQSEILNKFGSAFTDSDKNMSHRHPGNSENPEKKSGLPSMNDKSYQNSSDEKIKMKKVDSHGTVQLEFIENNNGKFDERKDSKPAIHLSHSYYDSDFTSEDSKVMMDNSELKDDSNPSGNNTSEKKDTSKSTVEKTDNKPQEQEISQISQSVTKRKKEELKTPQITPKMAQKPPRTPTDSFRSSVATPKASQDAPSNTSEPRDDHQEAVGLPEAKSSPLLLKSEKESALDYFQSLDSKKVDEAITYVDVENICMCLAHAILKHIEFSQGEVLIDDLVSEEEDIPQFSYEFGEDLRIDLEEIQQKKEMEQCEAQVKNIENFNKMEFFMNNDANNMQAVENGHVFDYQLQPLEEGSPGGSLLGELPPLNPINPQSVGSKFSSHGVLNPNQDLNDDQPPTTEGYNYSLVQMDDFLKDQGLFGKDSTNLVNNYYASLSMMAPQKPHFLPPPELGMIESLGSFENSSKYPGSVFTNKKSLVDSHSKPPSSAKTMRSNISREKDISEMKSLDSDKITNIEEEPKADEIPSPSDSNNFRPNSASLEEKIIGSKEETKSDKDPEDEHAVSQESYYQLEDITKEGLQKFLKDSMLTFNERYSIAKQKIEEDVEIVDPSFDLIYKYCKYVVIASKMEKEIPILALVYLERLVTRTGVLMNKLNWRRLILTTLCVASKIWDDDSLENEHFPKVMRDVTLQEINTFERILLDLIGYDLVIRGAEYARYYFILRTIAQNHDIKMPLQPLNAAKVMKLQQSTNDFEIQLRNLKKKSNFSQSM